MKPDPDRQAEPLYRHAKRQEWGLAIFAWQRDGHHAYQFEDGQLRVFANGFVSLLAEVDRPVSEADDTAEALNRLLNLNDHSAAEAKKSTSSRSTAALSFFDQVAVFVDKFPGGFQDPRWKQDVRGAGAKRRLKRHRDVAITNAQEALGNDRLAALIAAQRYGEVHAAVLELIDGTDLVSREQLDPIRKLPAAHHRGLAMAVRDLLHGGGPYERRFAAFRDKLAVLTSTGPSWQLVTVLGALVLPHEEIFVSPAQLREQSRRTTPQFEVGHRPVAATYERLAALVRKLGEALKGENLTPRDLFDVHDFIRETLKPASKERAEELRRLPVRLRAEQRHRR